MVTIVIIVTIVNMATIVHCGGNPTAMPPRTVIFFKSGHVAGWPHGRMAVFWSNFGHFSMILELTLNGHPAMAGHPAISHGRPSGHAGPLFNEMAAFLKKKKRPCGHVQ